MRAHQERGGLRVPPFDRADQVLVFVDHVDAAGNPGALPIVDNHWLLLSALHVELCCVYSNL